MFRQSWNVINMMYRYICGSGTVHRRPWMDDSGGGGGPDGDGDVVHGTIRMNGTGTVETDHANDTSDTTGGEETMGNEDDAAYLCASCGCGSCTEGTVELPDGFTYHHIQCTGCSGVEYTLGRAQALIEYSWKHLFVFVDDWVLAWMMLPDPDEPSPGFEYGWMEFRLVAEDVIPGCRRGSPPDRRRPPPPCHPWSGAAPRGCSG